MWGKHVYQGIKPAVITLPDASEEIVEKADRREEELGNGKKKVEPKPIVEEVKEEKQSPEILKEKVEESRPIALKELVIETEKTFDSESLKDNESTKENNPIHENSPISKPQKTEFINLSVEEIKPEKVLNRRIIPVSPKSIIAIPAPKINIFK